MSRTSYSSLSFKKMISSACALLVGVTLTAGCGGVDPESTDDSQSLSSVESTPLQGGAEEGNVSEMALCCFAACHDGAAESWRGPFPNVLSGNCTNYALYYCGQHHWPFKAAKWADCRY